MSDAMASPAVRHCAPLINCTCVTHAGTPQKPLVWFQLEFEGRVFSTNPVATPRDAFREASRAAITWQLIGEPFYPHLEVASGPNGHTVRLRRSADDSQPPVACTHITLAEAAMFAWLELFNRAVNDDRS